MKDKQWVKLANQAEDYIFFLRRHGLITETMVSHIRKRIQQLRPE